MAKQRIILKIVSPLFLSLFLAGCVGVHVDRDVPIPGPGLA
jgi:hypothetical protein